MKNKKKREKFEDDGRVIAPMNVPGMPWYDERAVKTPKTEDESQDTEQFNFKNLSKEEKKEYRRDTWRIIGGIILRILPFLLGGAAVFALIILLMWLAWK